MQKFINHQSKAQEAARLARQKKDAERLVKQKQVRAKMKKRILSELDKPANWTNDGCLVTYDFNKDDNDIYDLEHAFWSVCDDVKHPKKKLRAQKLADLCHTERNTVHAILEERYPNEGKPQWALVSVVDRMNAGGDSGSESDSSSGSY